MKPPLARPWTLALIIAIAVCAVRTAVLAFSGLGLSADEAHYWDWARHLDWSYPTKGPGIAYAIAAARTVLGDEPWMIRTVATVSGAVSMLLAFGLTRVAMVGAPEAQRTRAGWWALALVALFPAFQVTGHIATIDGPYVASWLGAVWASLAMLRRLESTRNALAPAIALGALLGVGFLFKYTILLLVPGLIIALLARRAHVHCWKRTAITLALVAIAFVLCTMPVWIWNQREGWPTVAHLLGHLGAPGGDVPTDGEPRAWTPLWFVEFVGSQLGMAGPFLVLMWLGVRRSAPSLERIALVSIAAPIFVVYLLVSLVTDAEANWPIAGYTTLLCLAAMRLPEGIDDFRARLDAWRAHAPPRPKEGILRKRPETAWQLARDFSLGYGVVPALLLLSLPATAHLLPLDRLTQSERLGDLVIEAMDTMGTPTAELVIVTSRYTTASRLAHELHRRLGDEAPLITSAASLTGDRKSAYDYWPETDPRTLRPGPVLFVGGASERKWTRRLDTGTIIPTLPEPDETFGGLYAAPGFRATRERPDP